MRKTTEQAQAYECEACGATSDKPKNCCGQPMKKTAQRGGKL